MKLDNKAQKEAFDFFSLGTAPKESFDLEYFTELFNFRGVNINLLTIAFKKKRIKLEIVRDRVNLISLQRESKKRFNAVYTPL